MCGPQGRPEEAGGKGLCLFCRAEVEQSQFAGHLKRCKAKARRKKVLK